MVPVYKSGRLLRDEWQNTDLPPGCLAIWNLGQAGYLFQGRRAGGSVCVDPYLSYAIEERNPKTEFKREFPPPLTPEELAGVDAVLVTHHHDDHFDPLTLRALAAASQKTQFVVPAAQVRTLRELGIREDRIAAAVPGRDMRWGDFVVQAIPAAHTAYEWDDHGHPVYVGYLMRANDVKVYHAGDTLVTPELITEVSAFRPDVVLLPINGTDYARAARGIVGNMTARDAADFAAAVGADLVVPIHYDMFPSNRENPAYFVDYVFQAHRSLKFHMMAVGERFVYVK
ncbi:MBL fold metallo-hydrolase [Alicyclobacillus cellulosilyticus]|uniref:MBL fold metallo-hydrolase n=1 Tax=Alicyclobacillus cellulosilyticus TaxID=1003997 RepID=A0A917NL03_9BACL|nr:MBL fold metallo-hydrolase [Alicyclobacillus cellulosilyticus]GGJ09167.1 MBL fold metallo-hydrolase [Alicyclobacillus cellulosilyticus]